MYLFVLIPVALVLGMVLIVLPAILPLLVVGALVALVVHTVAVHHNTGTSLPSH